MPEFEWLWAAWQSMGASRPHHTIGVSAGMEVTKIIAQPQRIPWREIHEWAAIHHYTAEERTLLKAVVHALDDVFLDHMAQKIRHALK